MQELTTETLRTKESEGESVESISSVFGVRYVIEGKAMIKEYDRMVLTADLPDYHLLVGHSRSRSGSSRQ
jgi:TolB-like protein